MPESSSNEELFERVDNDEFRTRMLRLAHMVLEQLPPELPSEEKPPAPEIKPGECPPGCVCERHWEIPYEHGDAAKE